MPKPKITTNYVPKHESGIDEAGDLDEDVDEILDSFKGTYND